MIDFSVKTYHQLSKDELHEILQLRSSIFVVEQDCVYQDIDGKDVKAFHVIGKNADRIIAYARIFKPGDYFKNYAIGRVLVKQTERKKGLASKLMKASIRFILDEPQKKDIELSAQTYLTEFYKGLNFKSVGDSYLEDGIPHIRMIREFKS